MTDLLIDDSRGASTASLLYNAFHKEGIHGKKEMPEDSLPAGVGQGSLEHLYYITLTVTIDYQRDANALWESSRKTFEDPKTRYLFYPEKILEIPQSTIINDMQKYGLSKKPNNDAYYWRTVALTFLKKYGGDPRNLLDQCGWQADVVLDTIRKGKRQYKGGYIQDFPFLRGNKIGPLWLRMLRDNIGLSLKNLDQIPIPVDIHVARSTLCLGIVRGNYSGNLNNLFEKVREAWFVSVKDLKKSDGSDMIALDVDEPLWHLSKYGCTYRSTYGNCPVKGTCNCKDYCIPGKIMIKSQSSVVMET